MSRLVPLGLAALALCLVGMVVGAVGFVLDDKDALDMAEWLTVPWTVIAGLPVLVLVVAAIGAPIALACEWIAALRRRRD